MTLLCTWGLLQALAVSCFALVVAVGCWLFRPRPAVVHSCWLIVLFLGITPGVWSIPVWPSRFGLSEPVTSPLESAQSTEEAEEDLIDLVGQTLLLPDELPLPDDTPVFAIPASSTLPAPTESHWPKLLLVGWLVGSLAWLGITLVRVVRFRRLLHQAEAGELEVVQQVEQVCAKLGLKHPPQVKRVAGTISPLLWAFGQPCLLLPTRLWERLNEAQRVTLLTHELVHLKRRDHWVRWLELLVTAVWWWLPTVWWAHRQLRQAEEECCDAWVVWAWPDWAKEYATALVQTVDFLAEQPKALPVAASGVGYIHDLKRRVTMIRDGKVPPFLSWPSCLGLLGAGLVVLLVRPGWAEDDRQPEPRPANKPADNREVPGRPVPPPPPSGTPGVREPIARPSANNLTPEIDQAKAEIEKLRAHLMAAERRLQELQARKEQPRPGPAGAPNKPEGPAEITIVIRTPDGKTREMRLPANTPQAAFDLDLGLKTPDRKLFGPGGTPGAPGFGPFFKQFEGQARPGPQDVERRLDQLAKEMEELRRMLRAPREGGAPPPGFQPPRESERRPEPNKPRDGDKKPESDRPRDGDKKPEGDKPRDGEKKPELNKPRDGEKKPELNKPRDGERKPEGDKPRDGDKKPEGDKPRDGDRKPENIKPRDGEKPRTDGDFEILIRS